MIRVEGLTKYYGAHPAVRDFNLRIGRGELCVLLGPSGCGKSTVLRLLNRLIEPDAGAVYIGGRETGSIPVDALRRDIGYVIQSVGLFPHMTVFDNIAVVPRLKEWERGRIAERVAALLDMTGLPASYARRYPRELSGGEAQRVGVARALAGEPSVLLMDEPFGALDLLNRRSLQKEFKKLQRRLRTTVLFVTHDVDEALELAETMAVMHQGGVVRQGRPEEFLHQSLASFIPQFLGSDYGLKLLGRHPLIGAMKKTFPAEKSGWKDREAVFKMTGSATMKDALSAMISEKASRLKILDAEGEVVGGLDIHEILEYAEKGTPDE